MNKSYIILYLIILILLVSFAYSLEQLLSYGMSADYVSPYTYIDAPWDPDMPKCTSWYR